MPITEIANCFRILMSAFNASQKHVDIFLTGSGAGLCAALPDEGLHQAYDTRYIRG